jgi:Uma2 family endonuclease
MTSTVRFTTDDLDALPDTLDDTRYELIDRELHVAHQPHWAHQFVSASLAAALHDWSRRTGRGRANVAPGVILSSVDVVAPDVVWVSDQRLATGLRADGRLHSAPEIVAEVLSQGDRSERRDRDQKRKLYAREGVDEYWLVDWRTRQVEVYRRVGNTLEPAATLTDADDLTSPLLPGFAFPVRELWEPAFD